MKIAISNIAWELSEDKEVLELLSKNNVPGIEIAPTKIWTKPMETTLREVEAYSKFWTGGNRQIVATQSLLFGRGDLQIFQGKPLQEETLNYLTKMIEITAWLGAKVAVFGSPKNRLIGNLPNNEVIRRAEEFFFRIGNIAQKNKIYFCIEPNPPEYGANFVTNSREGVNLVALVKHPNFQLHLDSGVMMVNREDYDKAIEKGFDYLKHFHVSEPNLQAVGGKKADHEKIAGVLKALNYQNWVSVEMRSAPSGNLAVIDKTLEFVKSIYGED